MKRRARAAPAPVPAPSASAIPRRWFDPRAPYLVPLLAALFARIEIARRLRFAAEDAYITFRYAEHFAQGLGPVYNPGERVLGFTSPLWMAWLAVGALCHVPLLVFSRASGIALDLATLVLMARLLSREGSPASAWAFGTFFALFPIFSANAVLGMETSLVVFLVTLAAFALATRRATLCGAALGALALARPEGLVIALAAIVLAPPRARWIAGGIALVGLGALTAYFGSPLPASVTAKALSYDVGAHPLQFSWIEGLVPGFFAQRWQELLEAQHLFSLSVIVLPAALVGMAVGWRERRASLLVAASGIAVLLGYCIVGVPYFGWYYVLPLFGWGAAAAIGLPYVIRSRLVWAALALYIVTDAPFLSIVYVARLDVETRIFGAAARTLQDASGGHGTLFVEPIGRIGHETGLAVIDEVGLVSPRVARRRAQGDGWYADVVRDARPDYLAVRPDLLRGNRALGGRTAPFRSQQERDAMLAAYEPVGPGSQRNDALIILKRKPETTP